MRKEIIACLTFLILPVCMCFAASKDDVGTSGAQFLKLGVGARAAAMGDAYSSIANDSTAIYWNPARLHKWTPSNISIMHSMWIDDVFYDWVSYTRTTSIGTFGVGVQYLSYGSIKGMDATGLELGSFSPSDMAGYLAYSNSIYKNTTFGVNVKYISSKIKDVATAYAGDVGIAASLPYNILYWSFVYQNIGTKLKSPDDEEDLPTNKKCGVAASLLNNWLVAVDVNIPDDNEINFCGGTEYGIAVSKTTTLFIRAGYNTKTTEIEGLKGITGGMGVRYNDLSFDYAFVPLGDLGDTHKVGISIVFGPEREEVVKKSIKVKPKPVKMPEPVITEPIKITNLAVADFTANNVSVADATIVAGFLRTELVKIGSFSVIEKANMDKILAEAAFQQTGCTTSECAVQIGKILNVRQMVVGSLSKLMETYFITVNLVEVETGKILKAESVKAYSAEELQSVCQTLAKKLTK